MFPRNLSVAGDEAASHASDPSTNLRSRAPESTRSSINARAQKEGISDLMESLPDDMWRRQERPIFIAISSGFMGSGFIGRSQSFTISRLGSTAWTHGDRAISIKWSRQSVIVLPPWRGVESFGLSDLYRMGDESR